MRNRYVGFIAIAGLTFSAAVFGAELALLHSVDFFLVLAVVIDGAILGPIIWSAP